SGRSMVIGGPNPCSAADHHSAVVNFDSLGTTAPSQTSTTALVMPPFDALGTLAGVVTNCTAAGGVATCSAVVRESTEGKRNFLVIPEWDVTGPPGCQGVVRRQPVPLRLAVANQAVFQD